MKVILSSVSVVLVLVIFIVSDEYFNIPDINKIDCKIYSNVVKSDIQGVVENVFIDKENHSSKTIFINSQGQVNVLYLDLDKSGLFEILEKGDSVLKPENTNVFHVFREQQDTQFELDFGCVQ